MSNADFIASIVTDSQKAQAEFGVFASVTIAQACWESGYGKYQGAAVQNDNNLFGIKFDGIHDPNLNITQGSKVGDGAGYYCHYDSFGDGCIDHGYFLLHNERYPKAGVFEATDGKSQLQCIMNAGYAEQAYYDGACAIIDQYDLTQYDTGSIGGGTDDESAKIVESAVTWLINIANDDTHGYDQDSRWSPDYDCSSFVISGYEQAGIQLKENGANSTSDMKSACLACGFSEVDWGGDESNLVRGDILLNEAEHVACYIGDGKLVEASQNELGHATGGQTGDQTGKEIYVRAYFDFPWDCILRYKGGSTGSGGTGGSTNPNAGEVYQKILDSSYNINQLTADEIKFLKTLAFNDTIYMKFTFNHNKRQIGKNFLGNSLTFDKRGYIIKDVRNDGLIVLAYGGSVCYKYINPKYIIKGD